MVGAGVMFAVWVVVAGALPATVPLTDTVPVMRVLEVLVADVGSPVTIIDVG